MADRSKRSRTADPSIYNIAATKGKQAVNKLKGKDVKLGLDLGDPNQVAGLGEIEFDLFPDQDAVLKHQDVKLGLDISPTYGPGEEYLVDRVGDEVYPEQIDISISPAERAQMVRRGDLPAEVTLPQEVITAESPQKTMQKETAILDALSKKHGFKVNEYNEYVDKEGNIHYVIKPQGK